MYEIISWKKQNIWRWPSVIHFFGGGTGAGLYIIAVFWGQNIIAGEYAFFLKLISPVLVIAGLLSVATEAGHPFKFLYLFANIKHSWMSREILLASAFIFMAIMELIINMPIISFLASTAAILFVISQAMVLYHSFAVPVWKQPAIPIFFISSSLLQGFGIFLLLCVSPLYFSTISILLYGIICICVTVLTWIWGIYIQGKKVAKQAIYKLHSTRMLIVGIGIGGLLPLIGVTALVLQSNMQEVFMVNELYALCGTSILIAAYYRLLGLILEISYLMPVSIKNALEFYNNPKI